MRLLEYGRKVILPRKYPESVKNEYLRFAKWGFIASVTGGCSSVLSTQSLLLAMGMSTHGSLTSAATFNWLIKDIAGQLGGLATAGELSKSFDNEAKSSRFFANTFLHITSLASSISLGMPHSFLLIASISNMVRHSTWIMMSSTRASLLSRLSNGALIGDLVAKSHAQNTMGSFFGNTIGTFLSYIFSLNCMSDFLTIQIPLTILGSYAMYQSVRFICANELSNHRLRLAVDKSKNGKLYPTPNDIGKIEPIISIPILPKYSMKPFDAIYNIYLKETANKNIAKEKAHLWLNIMVKQGWKLPKY